MARKSERERKTEEVISALLSCGTLAAAADKAGISESTLLRWLKEPAFAREYRDARRAQLEHTLHAMPRAAITALATLIQVMQVPDKFAAARVAAARTILEYAFRTVEITDVEARLSALEAGEEEETDADGA